VRESMSAEEFRRSIPFETDKQDRAAPPVG
jgi:hypothetical protein